MLTYFLKKSAGQNNVDTKCETPRDCFLDPDEFARHLIEIRFGTHLAGLPDAQFHEQSRRALWWQNAAFFPECFDSEAYPIDGMAMRQNVIVLRMADAAMKQRHTEVEELRWLLDNLRLSRANKSAIEEAIEALKTR